MDVVERYLGVPPGRVGIDRVQHALHVKARRIHVDEKHCRAKIGSGHVERPRHDDIDARVRYASDHPFLAIDDETIGYPPRGRLQ